MCAIKPLHIQSPEGGHTATSSIKAHAYMLQVFDKDTIGGDADTAAVRIVLSNQCLLALRSVGCNLNGVTPSKFILLNSRTSRLPSFSCLRYLAPVMLLVGVSSLFSRQAQRGACCVNAVINLSPGRPNLLMAYRRQVWVPDT